ncbi:hypothetical protein C488_15187 [Natrinema pellirubrum DSM 15624]|uniref:Uncharacterized protein n=1 Tax=Natrinema pellirubrum (strain DSM 15624 / CIP 106293 / JCM 10476 / NCIMB 786 / 157) TaxID=797303 RepID=L9YEZ5_NATP1|nr:hypothetical protein C488_15187 [Natrinema pellirubrum DSM 15624]
MVLPLKIGYPQIFGQWRGRTRTIDDDFAKDLLITIITDTDEITIFDDWVTNASIKPILRTLVTTILDKELLERLKIQDKSRLVLDKVFIWRLKNY